MKLVCPECGGRVSRWKLKCKKCGAVFQLSRFDAFNKAFRIETTRCEIQDLNVDLSFNQRFIDDVGKNKAEKYVMDALVEKIAEGLKPFIEVKHRYSFDPCECEHIVTGRLKVVRPENSLERSDYI